MIEAPRGTDLWSIVADATVITTNGDVNRDGHAVMGRGCALEAARRFPGIARRLARAIGLHGNHVHHLGVWSDDKGGSFKIIAFPVKHHWSDRASMDLIRQSIVELLHLVEAREYERVVMPRPGCGNGKQSWERVVKPLIEPVLDDRFVIVHK